MHLTQAVYPTETGDSFVTQLPHLTVEDRGKAFEDVDDPVIKDVLDYLQDKKDPRTPDVMKARAPGGVHSNWWRVSFKGNRTRLCIASCALLNPRRIVIDERIITPEALVNLVIKARLDPPDGSADAPEDLDERKRARQVCQGE